MVRAFFNVYSLTTERGENMETIDRISTSEASSLGFDRLMHWVESRIPEDRLFITQVPPNPEDDKVAIRIKVFTADKEFTISATKPRGGYHGYLGLGYSLTTPLPGESWTRGGDLTDGKYESDTFDRILVDILKSALLPISKDA